MGKRYALFIALSTLILVAYFGARAILLPPPAQQNKGDQQVVDKDDGQDGEDTGDKGDQGAGDKGTEASTDENGSKTGGQDEEPDGGGDQTGDTPADPPKPQYPQRWATLGSLDPESPYSALWIFNSRGGAIERCELNSERYVDLDGRSGYLGPLALTDEPDGGCRVNVVGDGTPAALAPSDEPSLPPGLAVGDVILAADGATLSTAADLESLLAEKRPGDELTLSVRRGDGDDATPLVFTATLRTQPLQLIGPEWEVPDDPTSQHPLSLLLTLQGKVGQKTVALQQPLDQNWEMHTIAGSEPTVEFRYVAQTAELKELDLEGPIEIVKRYRLPAVGADEESPQANLRDHLLVEFEIRNLAAAKQTISYRLDGPNGLPLEGWWYSNKVQPAWSAAGARDVIWSSEGRGHKLLSCPSIFHNIIKKKSSKNNLFSPSDESDDRDLRYIGLDTQYFATVLIPTDGETPTAATFSRADGVALSQVSKDQNRYAKKTNVTFRLISEPAQLAADDGVLNQSFMLYAGPKEPKLLAAYGLKDVTYYGWFGFVSRPLTGVLHFFYAIVHNYGIAIVLLTVLVRACLLPVSFKATKNAQMMQALAPEMKAIAEKYKSDMEKRGKAQRELFQKHNYNPFGGCLLLFLQLPVFLGLYRGLSVDISLRGQPLIPGLDWCSNLAAPDHLFRWFSSPEWAFGESGWLGPYFNILPLVTVALFLLQQKMFMPPATDDQTRMQQRMMNYMTLFMGVLFFKVPSGLCIYFITSSLWGVAERKLLPKIITSGPGAAKPAGKEGKVRKEKKSLLSYFKLASNGQAEKRARRRKQRKG